MLKKLPVYGVLYVLNADLHFALTLGIWTIRKTYRIFSVMIADTN